MNKQFDKAESFQKGGGGPLSYEWGPIIPVFLGPAGPKIMGAVKFYDTGKNLVAVNLPGTLAVKGQTTPNWLYLSRPQQTPTVRKMYD